MNSQNFFANNRVPSKWRLPYPRFLPALVSCSLHSYFRLNDRFIVVCVCLSFSTNSIWPCNYICRYRHMFVLRTHNFNCFCSSLGWTVRRMVVVSVHYERFEWHKNGIRRSFGSFSCGFSINYLKTQSTYKSHTCDVRAPTNQHPNNVPFVCCRRWAFVYVLRHRR